MNEWVVDVRRDRSHQIPRIQDIEYIHHRSLLQPSTQAGSGDGQVRSAAAQRTRLSEPSGKLAADAERMASIAELAGKRRAEIHVVAEGC